VALGVLEFGGLLGPALFMAEQRAFVSAGNPVEKTPRSLERQVGEEAVDLRLAMTARELAHCGLVRELDDGPFYAGVEHRLDVLRARARDHA
jgi:hypothetical protein